MQIIHSNNRFPFLEKNERGYILNINQRYVTITQGEEETHVWEIYQETFRRFPSMREKLDAIKSAVTMYANSNVVKQFTINNHTSWLDSEQRSSIKDAIEANINVGNTTYTLWINNNPIVLDCNKALEVISSLELYSSQCYNITSTLHKEIESCGVNIEAACNIDFTTKYPTHVNINTNDERGAQSPSGEQQDVEADS